MALDASVVIAGFALALCLAIVVSLMCLACAGTIFAALLHPSGCQVMGGSEANHAQDEGAQERQESVAVLARSSGARQQPALLGEQQYPEVPRGSVQARGDSASSLQRQEGCTIELLPRRPASPQVASSCTIVEIEESPRRPPLVAPTVGRHTVPQAAHWEVAFDHAVGGTPAPKPLPKPTQQMFFDMHVLKGGYAAQLAIHFGEGRDVHEGTVDTVVNAFGLDAVDICYSFLCLEQAAKGLFCKSRRSGTRKARIWVVALARFVLYAQGLQNVAKEEHMEIPCTTWGYSMAHFMREVLAAEAQFQQRFGYALVRAFQTEAIRLAEVARANNVLQILNGAAAVSSRVPGSKVVIPPAASAMPALENLSSTNSARPPKAAKRLALGNGDDTADAGPRKRQKGSRVSKE